MNHTCVTNTRNLIFGDSLEVRATMPISAGETLTTHYVSPLLHRGARQERLKERWFFDCICPRCRDPTDGGAFTSGLVCNSCPSGVILPPKGTKGGNYKCSTCGAEMSSREAASIVDMWQPMVQALQVVIMFSNCVIMFQCFRVYLFKVCY